jgi:lipoate-protein ligase A
LSFRVLVHGPGEGAFNMALDEALFLSAGEGKTTLRLYSFAPPTVSVGYRQSPAETVDLAACRELGVGCVRRPTGGRALLHHREITYSVAAPIDGAFRGQGVRDLYRSVTGAIRRALVRLGVPLDSEAPPASGFREPALHVPCLAVPGAHEVTAGGRKVVASAQRRGRTAFLQQGSILRRVDQDLWAKLDPKRTPLRAVGIDELPGDAVPEDLLVAALVRSFEELMESPASHEDLSAAERQVLHPLLARYRASESCVAC